MENKLNWKKVWKVVNSAQNKSNIKDTLQLIKDDLLKGLTRFKSDLTYFNKDADQINLKDNPNLSRFLKQLCIKLNLDLENTWGIFCNYIMFESLCKMDDMEKILKNEELTMEMIASVWHCYSLERMYMLRTFDYILHGRSDIFLNFVKEVSYEAIQESLMINFEYLISEINNRNGERCIDFKAWVARNNSEQLQILILLAATIELHGLTIQNLLRLLKLFQKTYFMEVPLNENLRAASRPSDLKKIHYAQYAIVFAGFKGLWYQDKLWLPYFDDFVSIMKEVAYSSTNFSIGTAWAILQLTLPEANLSTQQKRIINEVIVNAFTHRVFLHLRNVVELSIFEGTLGENVVVMGVAELVEVLRFKFTDIKVDLQDGALNLLIALLRSKKFASEFLAGHVMGLREMFCLHITLFPSRFIAFSQLYESLFHSRHKLEVIFQNLCNIPTFTEDVDTELPDCVLNTAYQPLSNCSLEFPAGSDVTYKQICKRKYRTVFGNYSYFNVLNHLTIEVLMKYKKFRHCTEDEANMLIAGYQLVLEISKRCPSLLLGVPDLEKMVQTLASLVCHVSWLKPKNYKLINAGYELVVVLFKYYSAIIVKEFFDTVLLPQPDKPLIDKTNFLTKYELLCNIYMESAPGACKLILPYIKLVRMAVEMKKYQSEVQIPGFMFLMGKIFPKVMNQHFMRNDELLEATVFELVDLLYSVLSQNRIGLSDIDLVIYDNFMDLLLNKENYTTALLKLFDFGSDKLDLLYITTPNIHNDFTPKILTVIEKSLLCLRFLFSYILRYSNIKAHSAFEKQMFKTGIEKKSCLNQIFGFINHGMTLEIPRTACCVLADFAKLTNSSIFYALSLNDILTQDVFLERLRDPAENMSMKITIINLVESCIHSQRDMTAAFFNASPEGRKSTVCMTNFLIDFMASIDLDDTTTLNSPMYPVILSLIHTIFKEERCELIKDVTALDTFWDIITQPLFVSTTVKLETIMQLFEIIIIELFINNTKSEKFTALVTKMFQESNDFLSNWFHRFISISKQNPIRLDSFNNKYTLNLASLMIWKKFLMSVKFFHPEYFEQEGTRLLLMHECMSTLHYLSNSRETVLIREWAQIYLMFISNKKNKDVCLEGDIYGKVPLILRNLIDGYFVYDVNFKISMLTIISIIIEKHSSYIMRNQSYEGIFLKHLKWCFRHESGCILVTKENEAPREENIYMWTLVVRILNLGLKSDYIKQYEHVYIELQYLDKLLEIFIHCLYKSSCVKIMHIAGNALKIYAESKIADHYLIIGLKKFYDFTFPERNQMLRNQIFTNGIIPQSLKDWWVIYPHILHLNKILLQRFGRRIADQILLFTESHEYAILDIIKTATNMGNYDNTRLAANVLYFIHECLTYKELWMSLYRNSFNNIMIALPELLNVSLTVFLRPEVLKFVPEKTCTEKSPRYRTLEVSIDVPHENLIQVVHSYLHLTSWICLCFTKLNPSLTDLFKPEMYWSFNTVIFNDFRIPIMFSNLGNVTYSTVLAALHYLCKAFNKICDGSNAERKNLQGEIVQAPTHFNNVIIISLDPKPLIDLMKLVEEELEYVAVGPQHDWLYNLDKSIMLLAIETLTTFIASHAYFTIQCNVPREILRYMRRELCEELEVFYDCMLKYLTLRAIKEPLPSDEAATSQRFLKPVTKPALWSDAKFSLTLDLKYFCISECSGTLQTLNNVSDSYLITLVHWLRGYCRLKHFTSFDRFLAKWHSKTTCVLYNETHIKYTSLQLDEDQFDDF